MNRCTCHTLHAPVRHMMAPAAVELSKASAQLDAGQHLQTSEM